MHYVEYCVQTCMFDMLSFEKILCISAKICSYCTLQCLSLFLCCCKFGNKTILSFIFWGVIKSLNSPRLVCSHVFSMWSLISLQCYMVFGQGLNSSHNSTKIQSSSLLFSKRERMWGWFSCRNLQHSMRLYKCASDILEVNENAVW